MGQGATHDCARKPERTAVRGIKRVAIIVYMSERGGTGDVLIGFGSGAEEAWKIQWGRMKVRL